MISGLPVTEERDAKQCFARKGGTARHSPFAHLCEGRFLRVGNETDRAKPATEISPQAESRVRTARQCHATQQGGNYEQRISQDL